MMVTKLNFSLDYALRGGWHDFYIRFSLSKLGFLWHTINAFVTACILYAVFSSVFDTKSYDYFLHICLGVVYWQFFSMMVLDGSNLYNSQKTILHNTQVSKVSVLFRFAVGQTIIFSLNSLILVIFPAIFFLNSTFLDISFFLITMANFLIFTLAVTAITFELGSKFPDFPPILGSLLQGLFFVTPIFWKSSSLIAEIKFLVFNPLYFYFEAARDSLLYSQSHDVFKTFTISIICTFIAVILTLFYRGSHEKRCLY